jgi:hypothetical protein
MRVNNKIYHMDCFHCTTCNEHLVPGDEYSLREDNLYCKTHSNSTNSNNTPNSCQNIPNMPLNSNKILIKREDIHIQQNDLIGL